MTDLHLDWETRCELDLKKVGLDSYANHPSCKVLMGGYAFDNEEPTVTDLTRRTRLPSDLRDALEDDDVTIWAFNAQFERRILSDVLNITVPIERFRCTQALAYMQSFSGNLDQVGAAVGLKTEQAKMTEGKRLIRKFSMPSKPTKARPDRWRDADTDPEDWELFMEYCKRDVVAERAIKRKLLPFDVHPREWETYHVDQHINDNGIPIDRNFVRQAIKLSDRRKAELLAEMQDLTGLMNPNSGPQFLPWLRKRGYWFGDLQKPTVKKVLAENKDRESGKFGALTAEGVKGLKLRQQSARTSTRKYNAVDLRVGSDNRLRFSLQFAGASRTLRWAGRGMQIQNLPGTPPTFEEDDGSDFILTQVTETIRRGDADELATWVSEPLDALSGLVRSSIRAEEGNVISAVDLASIESCVIGWLTDCTRLLNVFRSGKDAYKDFATDFFAKPYDDVTKLERKKSKPAVLGCGYRLGGGDLIAGKKTGLWGYAENMGIMLTREESHAAVKLWRQGYPEIPEMWYEYERAAMRCVKTKRPTSAGLIRFEYQKPYLKAILPSGRAIYYMQPHVAPRTMSYRDIETGQIKTYTKDGLSYMGKQQNGQAWVRVDTHGGKLIENFVQAIARDILRDGLLALYHDGFNIIFHVHDEIVCEQKKGDNYYTQERMRELMITSSPWAKGLPLNASGFTAPFYRKD